MALPQEVSQEIFTVIQGGSNLGTPAEIIQFTSDNGANTWNAVKQTYKGDNGTSFNYYVFAFTSLIEGIPVAVSAGASMLTMSVGAFGVGLAPALGILQGALLYNVAPEFWTTVGNELANAGLTIGGKVVCFMNEHGILTYPEQAIEIMKQALVDMDFFNLQPLDASSVTNALPDLSIYDLYRNGVVYGAPWGNTCVLPRDSSNPSLYYFIEFDDVRVKCALVQSSTTPEYYDMIFINEYQNSFSGELWSYPDGTSSHTSFIGHELTINDKTIYWARNGYACTLDIWNSFATRPYTYTSELQSGQTLDFGIIAWILSHFDAVSPNENLQNGAKYPTDDPFPLSYPNWTPNEFPEIDDPQGNPQQLPDTYPLSYPNILPETQPYQEPAQNPDPYSPKIPDEFVEHIENPENQPDYNPTPEPAPTPDPDIEDNPEPIPSQPEPTPQPDPIEPDPDPTPSEPTIVPTPPTTASSSKLFTVYNPSLANLNALGAYLWDSSLVDTLKKLWQNPLDGIISLIQVFATPVVGGSSNIMLGYLDSGVSAPVVSNQFVTIDCGTITLNEKNKNATDYTPYTTLNIYLPFIGITEIDANEFMNGSINVKYTIDVYTGTCLAQVKCTRTRDMSSGAVLYTFSGNCSQQLPLTSGDATGVLRALINSAGAGLSIATGGGLGVVAGAMSIANNLSHDMLHVGHSGNLSANAGIMGIKKPYLIINRQRPYNANSYNEYSGFPANKTVYINNCSGFTRFKSVRLQTVATDPERAEIENLLKEGVIF